MCRENTALYVRYTLLDIIEGIGSEWKRIFSWVVSANALCSTLIYFQIYLHLSNTKIEKIHGLQVKKIYSSRPYEFPDEMHKYTSSA